MNRREFLKASTIAAAGCALAPARAAAAAAGASSASGAVLDNVRVTPYFDGGWTMYMFSNRTIDIMLSTLFRSPSGRLVMIDGGWGKDGEFLLPVLKRLGGVVDAWFLTHAHGDHFMALGNIIKRPQCGGLKIGRVIHDFLPLDFIAETAGASVPWVSEFLDDLAKSGLKVEKPEPGQVFDFGEGMSFECLNGCDLSMRRNSVNNSSICYRVRNGGKTVLVTGDIGAEMGDKLLKTLPADKLKSDVCFLSHHGQDGAKKSFYAAVKPEMCVWPTTQWLWDNDLEAVNGPGSGPFLTNYVKCWMQELGVKRQILLTKDAALGPKAGAAAFAAGGFYGVRQGGDGRWWVVAPDGRDVFLRGVDHVNWNGHFCEALGVNPYREENRKRHASRADWEDETLSRLKAWGFNALGAGCSEELRGRGLVHMAFLGVGERFCAKGGECAIARFAGTPGTAFPNVFHADFAKFCDEQAATICAPQKDDVSVFGYFFDNELDWGARGASSTGMFDAVAKMPPSNPARKALDGFLAARAIPDTGADLPEDVKTEFLRLAARRYFETISAAIRRHDPNHLLLGARFAGLGSAHRVVWEEAGKTCDVLTFNNYPWADLDENVVYWSRKDGIKAADAYSMRYGWAKKPLMITEWSFPALDSGLPCAGGAGQRFRTQAERVQATELFARTLLALPFMVGYDYFMWVDEPELGISRNFPEDSNYGLVNGRGEPYAELTSMFSRLNPQAEALHARGELPPVKTVDFAARERRSRFPLSGASAPNPAATFSREGDRYVLSSNAGLVMKGRVGGRSAFDSVLADGLECGRFTFMVFHGEYQDIDRVESVQWLPERAALRIAGSGRSGAKAFRVTADIVPLADRPWFGCNIVCVENSGQEEFSDLKVFFRQYAPWSGDVAKKGGYKAPQNLWKAPSSAVWIRAADGAWCGAATYARTVRHFTYWISGDGTPHPDAMFSPQGSTILPPGNCWRPEDCAWMIAAAGSGGPAGWRSFLDEFAME